MKPFNSVAGRRKADVLVTCTPPLVALFSVVLVSAGSAGAQEPEQGDLAEYLQDLPLKSSSNRWPT
jgi:hypothetical protein